MFKNYIKIALRTLRNNPTYALINIVGLALGLAASMMIFLVVKNELSYDDYHASADRTYRITVHGLDYNPSVSYAVAPAFRLDFPEVKAVSQYSHRQFGLIKVGANLFNEENYAFADEQFAAIFDLGWIAGNPVTALKDPNSVVLNETLARKYFGDKDAIGKSILLDNKYDLVVTGVIRDLPPNTHHIFSFLVSWETIRKDAATTEFWSIGGGYLYITLPPNLSAQQVMDRLPSFVEKNWGKEIAKDAYLILQPLKDIHFDQRYIAQVSQPRSKGSLYGLAAVALFVIISACINFMNLATAQSLKRVREIGIRKSLGAFNKQLIAQVITETSLMVSISVMLAAAAVYIFIPLMSTALNVHLAPQLLLQPGALGALLLVAIITIVMAGVYPAIVAASYRAVTALKSGRSGSSENSYIRKGLVVIQFSITQILLVATIVAGSQMDYFLNGDLGFDKESVVTFPTGANPEVLRQRLAQIAGIRQISLSSGAPAYMADAAPFSNPEMGMDEVDVTEIKHVDENYLSMYKLQLLAGHPIRSVTFKDSVVVVLVNETLIKRMGIQSPGAAIGKKFLIGDTPAIIQGVVADFQSESKHKKRRACIIFYNPGAFSQAAVKIALRDTQNTLAAIKEKWSALNPESLFTYEFMDDHIASQYIQERNTYTAFRIFSAIAIVIGCLGLYGLVFTMSVQRRKEIGIRKVLGADVLRIVMLFFGQFIWLIVVASAIAAPIAWYATAQWLSEFAYHINVGLSVFVVAMFVTILIAAITLSYESIRAAVSNPVDSLRSE